MGQRVLPMLLEYQNAARVLWRSVLDREAFPVPFEELRAAVTTGIDKGFVHIAADIQPRTKPAFLA